VLDPVGKKKRKSWEELINLEGGKGPNAGKRVPPRKKHNPHFLPAKRDSEAGKKLGGKKKKKGSICGENPLLLMPQGKKSAECRDAEKYCTII